MNDVPFRIELSEAAIAHFHQVLKKSSQQAIFLGVTVAGCTGYQYDIHCIDAPLEEHASIWEGEDFCVYGLPAHRPIINGVRVDMEKTALEKKVVFQNPNEQASCGCGVSFSVKEE